MSKDIFLNDIRSMLSVAGYSDEEQNIVINSFDSFCSYMSSCSLLEKFLEKNDGKN